MKSLCITPANQTKCKKSPNLEISLVPFWCDMELFLACVAHPWHRTHALGHSAKSGGWFVQSLWSVPSLPAGPGSHESVLPPPSRWWRGWNSWPQTWQKGLNKIELCGYKDTMVQEITKKRWLLCWTRSTSKQIHPRILINSRLLIWQLPTPELSPETGSWSLSRASTEENLCRFCCRDPSQRGQLQPHLAKCQPAKGKMRRRRNMERQNCSCDWEPGIWSASVTWRWLGLQYN